ncbi:hypothetical protein PILCRDRAFT_15281 [Piloderma croceum F 1598]|uniref:Uncharacterized protein n=1 Tax=Piloderma croceum (strain F 1598) TaxID=765440 RepID=A0A0C3AHS3_PILCF|nr:hypothetical protein PILCRDRAFT_15281 [Piloderma croceum F 1598]
MLSPLLKASGIVVLCLAFVKGTWTDPIILDGCPGYKERRNIYGNDAQKLSLSVEYETESRIHLKITDPSTKRYKVPTSVLPRPFADRSVSTTSTAIKFNYTASPFSFSIIRTKTSEILFSMASHPILFEPQYLRVKMNLPQDANIYVWVSTHSVAAARLTGSRLRVADLSRQLS